MTFKTVLNPYVDTPITQTEYKHMELYLTTKKHYKRMRTWQVEDQQN